MRASIESDIKDSIATKQLVLAQLVPDIEKAANTILTALKNGNKILTCGNGGSAADAQHFSAELVARYDKERRSLPAIALTVDPSAVTAIGNDYSYEDLFARQIEGLGAKGDVLVAITTSGNSPNVLRAIAAAQKKGMQVIGLTGKGGGKMKDAAIHNIIVPSTVTARVQESHILIIHSWCKLIDDAFVH